MVVACNAIVLLCLELGVVHEDRGQEDYARTLVLRLDPLRGSQS